MRLRAGRGAPRRRRGRGRRSRGSQAVDADDARHLLDASRVAPGACRARACRRRRSRSASSAGGDAHVHLGGAGVAHHLDDLGRGGAADDPIVDQDHALARERHAVGVVLQPHAQMADMVGGLDEGAADIVVADDAELEGDAGLLGIADRRRHAAVGHRARRRRPRPGSPGPARRRCACGPRRRRCPRRRCRGGRSRRARRCRSGAARRANGRSAAHAVAVDEHDLARLDVAHEVGADDVERAGLRGQDPGAVRAGPAPAAARPADRARPGCRRWSAPPASRRPRPARSASTTAGRRWSGAGCGRSGG